MTDKKIRTYDDLFRCLAKATGKTPEELKTALEKAKITPSEITPKCLQEEELLNFYPSKFPIGRIAHFARCEYCSFLIGVEIGDPLKSHKCSEIEKRSVAVFRLNFWYVVDNSGEIIERILFCPYCGEKLPA